METWAIVVGAGSGTRFGGAKQYQELSGRRVIDLSLETAAVSCDGVIAVLPQGAGSDSSAAVETLQVNKIVSGGQTRAESVRAGLAALPDTATHVLIHDAARPAATKALYARVIDELRNGAVAVTPGVAVTDTIKRVTRNAAQNVSVEETLDRASLVAVQTPQGFSIECLRAAHDRQGDATDDAGLVESMGTEVRVVEGEVENIKITTKQDLVFLRSVFADRELHHATTNQTKGGDE